jgi:DedD protein
MAKSISAEELQLRKRARRRLIGAIALVTIVAVFLPMALDHEPKPLSQDISIQIPSPNSGAFTSKIAPVPDAKSVAKPAVGVPVPSETPDKADVPPAAEAAAKPAADTRTPPAYDTEAAAPTKPAAEQPKVQTTSAVKPPAKSAPAPKAAEKPKAVDQTRPDAKSAVAYVVQVAALTDADKAKKMQEQIAAAGVKSYTEVVATVRGNVTRVRAGPFASRDEAEKTRDQLKGMGLNGNLVPKYGT